MILPHFAILITALAVLFWSANKMISAAVELSAHYKMSPLIIGVVVIGFSTSSPEIAVSALAAWDNQISIAVGNAFGSNVSNLLLVLGGASLITTLHTTKRVISYLFPLTLAATLLPGILIFDLDFTRAEGILLFVFLVITLYLMAKATNEPVEVPIADSNKSIRSVILWLVLSITVLLIASDLAVDSAVAIAEFWDISKLVIGLTLVAIGTSLPEIVTSIIGVYRNHHGLVVGNILGSNIFNSLAVLGVTAVIGPGQVPRAALFRDFAVVITATLLLWALFANRQRLTRGKGIILLSGFVSYIAYLLIYAKTTTVL